MRFLPMAGMAATASAFLVVPEASSADVDSLPADARESWAQALDLECPGCPVAMPHSDDVTSQMESHLEMNFAVDLQHGDRLLLNGFELYPHADPFKTPLTAPHIVEMPEGAHNRKGMMRGGMMHSGSDTQMDSVDALGFTMASQTTAATEGEDEFEHVVINLQIIEVNNMFVSDIPSIHIDLVKDAAGMIAISNIEAGATHNSANAVAGTEDDDDKCKTWLCKWMASLEDHWKHWRPHCGKGPGNHHNESGHHHGPGHHDGPHHGNPHHGKPHHGHHGDQPEEPPASSFDGSERPWSQLMWSVTSHILLPVLIGIIAGVAMSLLGMVIGTVIIYVYRAFFRSSSPNGREADIPKEVIHEEKAGLMDNQEPPPSYEEDPTADADSKV